VQAFNSVEGPAQTLLPPSKGCAFMLKSAAKPLELSLALLVVDRVAVASGSDDTAARLGHAPS